MVVVTATTLVGSAVWTLLDTRLTCACVRNAVCVCRWAGVLEAGCFLLPAAGEGVKKAKVHWIKKSYFHTMR